MNFGFLAQRNKPNIKVTLDAEKGIQHHNSPVLIFDSPYLPRAKARFSVVDPPKDKLNSKEF